MRLLFLFLSILIFGSAIAQGPSPKREFRAAWIATVSNIDWPSKPGLPSSQQQSEFIARLDQLQKIGCNAVIVQIRPAADAFYESNLEPWSRYLTGSQGKPPMPYYDPLSFMIFETHARNMEFHAWFNPYRALTNSAKNPNPTSHVTHQHPEWIIPYDGKSYLNPGLPEVRSYVLNVIADVVKRYDIDAVHLDDYFYPYRVPGKTFGDYGTYKKYGSAQSLEDWRRSNVNDFISRLYATVHGIKNHVKVGISPFGVWRNSNRDPRGSNTTGGTSAYDDLSADILLWIQKGWLDYCLPQLYWERGHRLVAFETLMPWWYGQCFNRHMYFGLGLYRMLGTPTGKWGGTQEIMSQINEIRGHCGNSGYALYSASNLDKIKAPIYDSLKVAGRYPALLPAMPWLDSLPPAAPQLIQVVNSQGKSLKWQIMNPSNETLRYVVYRFSPGEPQNLDRSDRIMILTQSGEWQDPKPMKGGNVYVVTALDRLWNESKASNALSF